jgi:hypothetical protein
LKLTCAESIRVEKLLQEKNTSSIERFIIRRKLKNLATSNPTCAGKNDFEKSRDRTRWSL